MSKKTALVTGSTSGIGLAIATRLGQSGCDVIITGLGEQKTIDSILSQLRSVSSEGRFHFVGGDLATDEGVADLCRGVITLVPDGVDMLINNAGIQHVSRIETYPVATWHKMMAINLTAPFLLIQHFLPFMKKKGWGRIVNTASLMSTISAPGKIPYTATKTGLIGITRGVALEAGPFGVTCNAVCPSFTDTDIVRSQVKSLAAEQGITSEQVWVRIQEQENICNTHPTKKPVTVEQISSLVNYLCSEDAASINGASVAIDAGNSVK